MRTADDEFSVTVITVRRGKIPGQVGQPIFLQSVHPYCLWDPASLLFSANRGLLPRGGGKVTGTYS